ncbi:hypothetical protein [Arthrobacter humicola]
MAEASEPVVRGDVQLLPHLAGFQSVKPDRMVIRFVEEHAGLQGKLTPMQTAELINQVAKLYPTQPRRLDHIIWRHVSGREIFREDELN